jgi:hypothetical protein
MHVREAYAYEMHAYKVYILGYISHRLVLYRRHLTGVQTYVPLCVNQPLIVYMPRS